MHSPLAGAHFHHAFRALLFLSLLFSTLSCAVSATTYFLETCSMSIFSSIIISLLTSFSWPSVSAQYGRYIADRTGIIATANFPLIWLFGLRNNTLMWLTGWDIGTYNNFHRWVARVATVEAIVHSVVYTILVFECPLPIKFRCLMLTHHSWRMAQLSKVLA